MSTPASALKQQNEGPRGPVKHAHFGRPPAPPVNALPAGGPPPPPVNAPAKAAAPVARNANKPPRQPQQAPQEQPPKRPVSQKRMPIEPTLHAPKEPIANPPPQPTPGLAHPVPGAEQEEEVLRGNRMQRRRSSTPGLDQRASLKGSSGMRASPSLNGNVLMRSTDTFVADARDHPQAHFTQLLEEYCAGHKKEALHALKVIKIPLIEHHELRIKSYSSSQILETPITVSSDIYTAMAYGLYGDATLGEAVRTRMVDTLRDLSNWLEADDRSDIQKILPGMSTEDVGALFRYIIPKDDAQPPAVEPVVDGAAGPSTSPTDIAGPSGTPDVTGDDKGKKKEKTAEEKEKKKKEKEKRKTRKGMITRDTARDQRYARYLRGMSNDIAHFDDPQGAFIHPLSIIALGVMLYGRPMLFFSVSGTTITLQSVIPPHPTSQQLPIYLACDEKDPAMVYMLVPQQELFTFEESQMFYERHVMETVALVPAYNEGEEEIMRTFLSFKKECKEEVQLIFFVDGVRRGGADVNHNTLQALLNHFDFVKMGKSAPIARFGKDDLGALVADVCTLDDVKNATAEYVGQDRADVAANIAIRVWVKKNNSGKKQSQLKFFEYLSARCIQPRYLLFVDSDTRFEDPAVSMLKVALDKANTGKVVPELGGTTGEIVVENLSAGFFILGATQYFEYKMSHHLGKRAEASFGRVSCLAGAFSMFECRALMDPRVIADFATETKDSSLWEFNKKNLGEDRYLTAQLLEAGYQTSFEPGALSHTVAPATLKGFIAQRRRWDNSTLVNQVDLIFAEKESVFSLWGGRYTLPWVWNFIDFFFTLFMPGNMVLLLVSIINSIIQLSGGHDSVNLTWVCPLVLTIIWGFFFVLPLVYKNPGVLNLDLYLLKIISAMTLVATVLLFAYMYSTSQIWLIVIATWVFLGPYAFTLIIRMEVVCMLCGPLFLLMTPVMFLFLKFYALANFAERSWGTRVAGGAAKDGPKDAANVQITIGFVGLIYLAINIGYMIVAVLYASIFMWVFSVLVSAQAFTRLIASLALTKPLGRYRRMLGTVGMFDGLFAVSTVVLFRMMLYYNAGNKSYSYFYNDSAVLWAALVRAIVVASWYLGMRRSGWIVYGLCVIATLVEGGLIIGLKEFNMYGLVLGVAALGFTIAEGFLVWKCNHPEANLKKENNFGLAVYMAYIQNVLLLIVASAFCYLPVSDLPSPDSIAAPVILLPFAIIAGIWMWALHLRRMRAWVLVLHAIICNTVYLIIAVIAGEVLVSSALDSFSTGYFPYVALMSMIYQLLLSWSSIRWAIRVKTARRLEEEEITNRASVNPTTGSMWPLQAEV